LPIADKVYLTRVHTNFPNADTFFFPLDTTVFKLKEEIAMEADDKHAFAYTFQIWEREN
jgi:dihydrofolate reductase